MDCRQFRFRQRRTSITGRKPRLSSLYDGELYLNTADGKAYFKNNTCSDLYTFITDASGNGLNNVKFSGANCGDIPIWIDDKFIPTGINNFFNSNQNESILLTGDQNISGIKNFYSIPTVNGTGLLLSGDVVNSSIQSFFAAGEVVSEPAHSTITGLRYFDSNVACNWFCNSAWFLDNQLQNQSNDLPFDFTRVKICNDNSVYIDLDCELWVHPKSIDSSSITDGIGICLSSSTGSIFTGVISGDFSFFGNAIFSGKIGQENFNDITCRDVLIDGANSYGICSYSTTGSCNTLYASSFSTILNGSGNSLCCTHSSAVIGNSINITCGQSDTLYVKNICLVNNGKIYGDGSQLTCINAGGGGQPSEDPYHSVSNVCCYITTNNNSPIVFPIHELLECQNILFTASVIGVGTNQYSSNKIEGMIRQVNNSVAFTNNPSKSIFSKSNSFLDVNVIANTTSGTLDLQIIGHSTDPMDWYSKVELLKIIKQ